MFILTVSALEDLKIYFFFPVWFEYSRSWIFSVGLGLLSTTEGWTRWPPGLFRPKLFWDSNCLLIFWTKLSWRQDLNWYVIFSYSILLAWTYTLGTRKETPALRLNEFICKSYRKSHLIPNFFDVFFLWHTLKLNYRIPSEHAWNFCDYCGLWLQFNSKP